MHEVNPKKSANFAKVLENRSRIDIIDTKTSYAFHAWLTEEGFRILEIDEIAEQLGARLGSSMRLPRRQEPCSPTTCVLQSTKGS